MNYKVIMIVVLIIINLSVGCTDIKQVLENAEPSISKTEGKVTGIIEHNDKYIIMFDAKHGWNTGNYIILKNEKILLEALNNSKTNEETIAFSFKPATKRITKIL